MTLALDLRFLLENDQKSYECYTIFPYVWSFVFANASVICVCYIHALYLLFEFDKKNNAYTNNIIIYNRIKHNLFKKLWNYTMISTILQILLFIAYICTYQIIEPVCCTAYFAWTNMFCNFHNIMRYIFPCLCVILLLLFFVATLYEKIKNKINMIEM